MRAMPGTIGFISVESFNELRNADKKVREEIKTYYDKKLRWKSDLDYEFKGREILIECVHYDGNTGEIMLQIKTKSKNGKKWIKNKYLAWAGSFEEFK